MGQLFERAEVVHFEKVAQAMQLKWAWFLVRIGSGSFNDPQVMIRPTTLSQVVSEKSASPGHWDFYYEFNAVDFEGNTYAFKVYEKGIGRQRSINYTPACSFVTFTPVPEAKRRVARKIGEVAFGRPAPVTLTDLSLDDGGEPR